MRQEAQDQLFAEDLKVGQSFSGPPRVIDDGHFKTFAQLTGDNHPIHYDDAFASKSRFGKRLAHGLLLVSMTALGATPMSSRLEDSLVAFAGESFRFLKPVFIGDTVNSSFEVAAIERKPGRDTALVHFDVRLIKGAGEIVLEGRHTYLLLCRPSNRGGEVRSHAV